MNERTKIYQKLKEKFTLEELADAVMVSEELSEEEERKERKAFAKLRLERKANMSDKERLLSSLLSMKYQMKSYIESREYDKEKCFGCFLKSYIKITGRTQKKIAQEIGVSVARIRKILKGKEVIGEAIAYRLERHSGEIIPAIFWWKLMQKEVEQAILTGEDKRIKER